MSNTNTTEAPRGPFDHTETTKPFDVVGFILDYETGELDRGEVVAGFQHLIDSGLAFQLQGHHSRTAEALIHAGHCTAK